MTAVERRVLGNICYGKIFRYDAPNNAGGGSHVGNFLRDFNFKLADWRVGGFGKNIEFRADSLLNGVLRLDNARDAVNVATFIRILRVADGRDNVAGRSGGVVSVHVELCGVFCRSFPRRHSSDTTWAIRGGKGIRT